MRTPLPGALTAGFHRALLAGSIFMAATAVIGLRAANIRGDAGQAEPAPVSELVRVPAHDPKP